MNAKELYAKVCSAWRPPPDLLVSEWADQKRYLPASAAEPGRWKTLRTPYLREIMDTAKDPDVREVWWMASSQVGKTEAILNLCGYFIDCDPGPILHVQPTIEMAESWSKDRFQPMLRDSPALAVKVADNKVRDSGNTILHKGFGGGSIDIAGANSPSGLASRPKRLVIADEVDRYEASAGREGDPIELARRRSITYWNRFFFAASTPTIKDHSRIEKGFLSGDQRHYHLPCPHCGHKQALKWEGLDFSQHGTRENPVYICAECDNPIEHNHKGRMLVKGEWVPSAPFKNGVRSYQINELYSPWSNWATVVENFYKAREIGPEAIMVWRNTALGLTWEQSGEVVESKVIESRSESLEFDETLPEGVLCLTAGCDVQHDRLEYEIVGWGSGEESWSLDYGIIQGMPSDPGTWQDLEKRVMKPWETVNGNALRVLICGIDSGDGKQSDHVMAFTAGRSKGRFGFLPFKGASKFDAPIWTKPNISKNRPTNPWMIGVSQCKLRIYDALNVSDPGPRYMHFPKGRPTQYYRGLTSEKLVSKRTAGGMVQKWEKRYDQNEPLDCRVYAYAAMKILNPNWDLLKNNLEKTEETGKKPTKFSKKLEKIHIKVG